MGGYDSIRFSDAPFNPDNIASQAVYNYHIREQPLWLTNQRQSGSYDNTQNITLTNVSLYPTLYVKWHKIQQFLQMERFGKLTPVLTSRFIYLNFNIFLYLLKQCNAVTVSVSTRNKWNRKLSKLPRYSYEENLIPGFEKTFQNRDCFVFKGNFPFNYRHYLSVRICVIKDLCSLNSRVNNIALPKCDNKRST